MTDFSSLIQKAKENNEYWESKVRHKIALALLGQMQDLGLTQVDLAKESGVSPAYISRVLSGNENLSIKTIIKLTRAIKLSFDISAHPTAPIMTQIPDTNSCSDSDWLTIGRQSQFRRNHCSPSLRIVNSSEAMNETAYQSVVTTNEPFAVAA